MEAVEFKLMSVTSSVILSAVLGAQKLLGVIQWS